MRQPRISIIVPVYNVEPFIDECIQSVLCQSFQDFELLLINDGTPDKSGEICDQAALLDSRIRVIHKPNEGLSLTRNKGIELATGDYLLFLDSDDTLTPNALQHSISIADSMNAEVVVLGVLRRHLDERTEPLFPQQLPENATYTGSEYFCEAMEIGCYNTMAQVYMVQRLKLLDWNVRFYPGLLHEDILYSFTLLQHASTVAVSHTPSYIYRFRPGSMANSISKRRLDSLVFLKEEFSRFEKEATTPRTRQAIKHRLFGILNLLLKVDLNKSIPRTKFYFEYFRTCLGNKRFIKMAIRGILVDYRILRK